MGTAVPEAEEASLQELTSGQGQQRRRLWPGLAPPAVGHRDQPGTPASEGHACPGALLL